MKHPESDIILGLDIGTFSVKAVLGRALPDDSLELLAFSRISQSRGAMSAGAIVDIPSVISACEKSILEVEQISGKKAKKVVVGLAGEQVKCSTSLIHYRRSRPDKPLLPAEMSGILERVQFETGKKAQKEIALDTDNPLAEVSLINSAIISITIDGQRVNNPIGFKGTDVALEFYTAFAPRSYLSAIERVCTELELDLVATAVDPFASCRALIGNADSTDSPAVIIDVGSQNTNVAVIDERGIRGTATFGMGSVVAEKSIDTWLDGLSLCLSELPHIDTFPSSLILCGGGAEVPEISEALAVEKWYDGLSFPRRPVVSLADPASLPSIKFPGMTPDFAFVTSIGLLRVAIDATHSMEDLPLRTRLHRLLEK